MSLPKDCFEDQDPTVRILNLLLYYKVYPCDETRCAVRLSFRRADIISCPFYHSLDDRRRFPFVNHAFFAQKYSAILNEVRLTSKCDLADVLARIAKSRNAPKQDPFALLYANVFSAKALKGYHCFNFIEMNYHPFSLKTLQCQKGADCTQDYCASFHTFAEEEAFRKLRKLFNNPPEAVIELASEGSKSSHLIEILEQALYTHPKSPATNSVLPKPAVSSKRNARAFDRGNKAPPLILKISQPNLHSPSASAHQKPREVIAVESVDSSTSQSLRLHQRDRSRPLVFPSSHPEDKTKKLSKYTAAGDFFKKGGGGLFDPIEGRNYCPPFIQLSKDSFAPTKKIHKSSVTDSIVHDADSPPKTHLVSKKSCEQVIEILESPNPLIEVAPERATSLENSKCKTPVPVATSDTLSCKSSHFEKEALPVLPPSSSLKRTNNHNSRAQLEIKKTLPYFFETNSAVLRLNEPLPAVMQSLMSAAYFPSISEKSLQREICSMLNHNGGTIFIGLTPDKLIKGVSLTRKRADEFKIAIDQNLRNFRPLVTPDQVMVRFYEVSQSGPSSEVIRDLYVIQINVSCRSHSNFYSTCVNELYIREDEAPVLLKAPRIVEHVMTKFEPEISASLFTQGVDPIVFQRMSQDDCRRFISNIEEVLFIVKSIKGQQSEN